MQHAAEVRRCLLELDVKGMRKLHAHIWPQYPQPGTDHEFLYSMHLARLDMKNIHPSLKQYSREWLAEQRRVVSAVGVASRATSSASLERSRNVQEAMLDAVNESIKAGIDIDIEAHEVSRRMMIARRKA